MPRIIPVFILTLLIGNMFAAGVSDSISLSRKINPKNIPIKPNNQLNTDRPSFSDNSSVLPTGGFQNENGFQINFIQKPNSPTNYTGILPFSSFRLSFNKRMEVRLATAILRDPQNNLNPYGISDLEVGFKFQIKENIAWISHLGIPNGSDGYSRGTPYFTNKLSATLPIGKTALLINTGLTLFKNPTTDLNQQNWLSTLVISREINSKTFVFMEALLQNQISGSGLNRTLRQAPGMDFGFARKFLPNTQIDLSIGRVDKQPFVNLGFSWGAFKSTIRKIRPLITPDS